MALMIDSTDVRKSNLGLIRKVFWEGGKHTKQTMSKDTGLSVATCNTLLNELEASGEITGTKAQLNGIGRSTMVYSLNEEYESILCVSFDLNSTNSRVLTAVVLTMLGKQIYRNAKHLDTLTDDDIKDVIKTCISLYPNVSSIMVGTNGVVDNGILRMTDIPEIEGMHISDAVKEAAVDIPCHITYDCQYRAYGAYISKGYTKGTLTLFYCLKNVVPGSASIVNRHVINGRNGFAGMTGYIPFGTDIEHVNKQIAEGRPEGIAQAIVSIISTINPDEIVFAGNVIDSSYLEKISAAVKEMIPEVFIPQFSIAENFGNDYYLEGMYQKAKELKTNVLNI